MIRACTIIRSATAGPAFARPTDTDARTAGRLLAIICCRDVAFLQGGKVIRGIIEATGVKMDVEDDGTVTIASADEEAAKKAIEMVQKIAAEAEIGKIYKGTVRKIVDFGAFVEILPGTDGLIHISQLAPERVRRVSDVLKEGDEVMVKVLEIDRQGKIRLSRKDALQETGQS